MSIREQKLAWYFVGTLLIVAGLAIAGFAVYVVCAPKSAFEPANYYVGLAAAAGLLFLFGIGLVVFGALGFVEFRRLEQGKPALFR